MMSLLQAELENIQQLFNDGKAKEAFQACFFQIQRHPYIAQLWVFLGHAMLLGGCGKMAEMAFNRALLLDPKADWAKDIPGLIASVPQGTVVPEITKLFEVAQPQITAAILCKNESRCIERCLASITDAVDEILVVDTGSTDDSLEIVRTFPKARIVHFKWCDDFSAARNFGLHHVRTEWVLWMDADEYLESHDVPAVKVISGIFQNMDQPAVIGIVRQDITENRIIDDYGEFRMYKTTNNFRYWYRIHEKIGGAETCDDPGIYRTYVRIRLFHDGYDKAILTDKKKIERNLTLLEESVRETPNDTRLLFFFGRELYASGNSRKASEVLKVAEKLSVRQGLPDVARPVRLFQIKVYIKLNELDAAEETCFKILSENPEFPEAFYYLALIQLNKSKSFLLNSKSYLDRLKKSFVEYSGSAMPDSEIRDYGMEVLEAEIRHLSGSFQEIENIRESSLSRLQLSRNNPKDKFA